MYLDIPNRIQPLSININIIGINNNINKNDNVT